MIAMPRAASSLPSTMTRRMAAFAALAALSLLAACSGGSRFTPVVPAALRSIKGTVHGGQQPITGATVQLYAVGLTGDGTAAKPLLTATVKTDNTGSFDLTGLYTCPADTTLVYLVGTGGNPGLGSGANNPNISMIAALGPCGVLAPTTNVSVDELTTIGSLSPLAEYMSGYAGLGSAPADAYALADAFNLVGEFTDTSIGSVPGPDLPEGFYASQTEINTLGDILASCINSTGGTAGDGSPCGQLFTLTTSSTGVAPTDTIGAALQILKNPGTNLPALLALIPANPPYLPTLTTAPVSIAPRVLPIAQTPVISLPSGAYTGAQVVTLTDGTPGATIFYSTATSPTASSYVPYAGPIPITLATTLSTYAGDAASPPNYITSPTATATYTFTTPVVPTLSFGPNTRTFTSSVLVSIASSVGGTQIYYTTDGSQPDPATSMLYTAPFTVTSTTTITAVGVTPLYPNTAITTTTFTVESGVQPQTITTVAGNYSADYAGDGGPAVAASLNSPNAIAFDKVGNMYIADTDNNVVREVDTNGNISTFAGVYTPYLSGRFCGDHGPATQACLNGPAGLAFDSKGNLYIADGANSAVRRVDTSGIITTFAGNGNVDYDPGGNGGFSDLVQPTALVIDSLDNVYVSDYYNSTIFKISPSGAFSTYAGTYTKGYYGGSDGQIASSTTFAQLGTMAIDKANNLYVVETGAYRVRRIDYASKVVTTVAGTGEQRFTGDGGSALSASFLNPLCIAVDGTGNIFVSDPYAGVVREITTSGIIYRIAGAGDGMTPGDGGNATDASLFGPTGLAIDAQNNLYIASAGANVVREVTAGPPPSTTAPPVATPVEGDYTKASLQVALTSATPGSTIYYTTDGSVPTPQSNLYTGPVTLSDQVFLQAYAVSPGILDSGAFIGDYLVSLYPTGVPTFSPCGYPNGNNCAAHYNSAQTITISSSSAGATIYYTTDGSTPTSASTQYTGPIPLSLSEQINAIATLAGHHDSRVGSASYTIDAAPPTFSLKAGVYYTTQSVMLSTITPNADIYYTTDGTTPSSASTQYSGPITVASSTTIQAVAISRGSIANSDTVSAYYKITPYPPVMNPTPGEYTYTTPPTVAITSQTAGATVYYTLDGTYPTPGNSSTMLYSAPFPVSSTLLVQAIATMSGLDNSSATSGNYLITPAPPVFSVASGTYTSKQHVAITSTTAGAQIYYTLDGSTPTTSSALYSGPITLSESRILTAITHLTGLTDTLPAIGNYIVTGTITTVAGSGIQGYTGDGAQATSARLNRPVAVAVDSTGILYIADRSDLRKVAVGGTISTFGPALSTSFNPTGVAVDGSNNLYISDQSTSNTGTVKEVSPSGTVSTLVSGAAPNADIAIAPDGTVYYAQVGCTTRVFTLSGSNVVGKDCTYGINQPVADGYGTQQVELSAQNVPIAISPGGVLYFAYYGNIFKINGPNIASVSPNYYSLVYADGGPASATAIVPNIQGMAFDSAGNLYFTTAGSVRKIAADGVVSTVAGPPPPSSYLYSPADYYAASTGFKGDGGNAVDALFANPGGIAVDSAGNLYVADTNNNRIRKITVPQ